MFSYYKKFFFLTNFLKKSKVTFNSNTLCCFTNYIGFQHYAVSHLSKLTFSVFNTIVECPQDSFRFKTKKTKLFNSQFRF